MSPGAERPEVLVTDQDEERAEALVVLEDGLSAGASDVTSLVLSDDGIEVHVEGAHAP